MWLDATKNIEWEKVFNGEDIPRLVILNPGKRKRYVLHDGELSFEALSLSIFFFTLLIIF